MRSLAATGTSPRHTAGMGSVQPTSATVPVSTRQHVVRPFRVLRACTSTLYPTMPGGDPRRLSPRSSSHSHGPGPGPGRPSVGLPGQDTSAAIAQMLEDADTAVFRAHDPYRLVSVSGTDATGHAPSTDGQASLDRLSLPVLSQWPHHRNGSRSNVHSQVAIVDLSTVNGYSHGQEFPASQYPANTMRRAVSASSVSTSTPLSHAYAVAMTTYPSGSPHPVVSSPIVNTSAGPQGRQPMRSPLSATASAAGLQGRRTDVSTAASTGQPRLRASASMSALTALGAVKLEPAHDSFQSELVFSSLAGMDDSGAGGPASVIAQVSPTPAYTKSGRLIKAPGGVNKGGGNGSQRSASAQMGAGAAQLSASGARGVSGKGHGRSHGGDVDSDSDSGAQSRHHQGGGGKDAGGRQSKLMKNRESARHRRQRKKDRAAHLEVVTTALGQLNDKIRQYKWGLWREQACLPSTRAMNLIQGLRYLGYNITGASERGSGVTGASSLSGSVTGGGGAWGGHSSNDPSVVGSATGMPASARKRGKGKGVFSIQSDADTTVGANSSTCTHAGDSKHAQLADYLYSILEEERQRYHVQDDSGSVYLLPSPSNVARTAMRPDASLSPSGGGLAGIGRSTSAASSSGGQGGSSANHSLRTRTRHGVAGRAMDTLYDFDSSPAKEDPTTLGQKAFSSHALLSRARVLMTASSARDTWLQDVCRHRLVRDEPFPLPYSSADDTAVAALRLLKLLRHSNDVVAHTSLAIGVLATCATDIASAAVATKAPRMSLDPGTGAMPLAGPSRSTGHDTLDRSSITLAPSHPLAQPVPHQHTGPASASVGAVNASTVTGSSLGSPGSSPVLSGAHSSGRGHGQAEGQLSAAVASSNAAHRRAYKYGEGDSVSNVSMSTASTTQSQPGGDTRGRAVLTIKDTSIHRDIADVLKLTDLQIERLTKLTRSTQRQIYELNQIDAFFGSLVDSGAEHGGLMAGQVSPAASQYLMFPVVEMASQGIRETTSAEQFERFLKWTDSNDIAISRLPYPKYDMSIISSLQSHGAGHQQQHQQGSTGHANGHSSARVVGRQRPWQAATATVRHTVVVVVVARLAKPAGIPYAPLRARCHWLHRPTPTKTSQTCLAKAAPAGLVAPA
jgi:hypothetical protein